MAGASRWGRRRTRMRWCCWLATSCWDCWATWRGLWPTRPRVWGRCRRGSRGRPPPARTGTTTTAYPWPGCAPRGWSGSGRRTGSSPRRGTCGTAPSCTWDAWPGRAARGSRGRTGTSRRTCRRRSPRTGGIIRFCTCAAAGGGEKNRRIVISIRLAERFSGACALFIINLDFGKKMMMGGMGGSDRKTVFQHVFLCFFKVPFSSESIL